MSGEISPLPLGTEVTNLVATAAPSPASPRGAFAKVLERVTKDAEAQEQRLDKLGHAGSGAPLETHELLALQLDVARYSTRVELTAKLVGQATQGVQTVVRSSGQ